MTLCHSRGRGESCVVTGKIAYYSDQYTNWSKPILSRGAHKPGLAVWYHHAKWGKARLRDRKLSTLPIRVPRVFGECELFLWLQAMAHLMV